MAAKPHVDFVCVHWYKGAKAEKFKSDIDTCVCCDLFWVMWSVLEIRDPFKGAVLCVGPQQGILIWRTTHVDSKVIGLQVSRLFVRL